jgi:hypothetical protein
VLNLVSNRREGSGEGGCGNERRRKKPPLLLPLFFLRRALPLHREMRDSKERLKSPAQRRDEGWVACRRWARAENGGEGRKPAAVAVEAVPVGWSMDFAVDLRCG